MADQNQWMYAKEVFKTLCEMLDARGWKYKKDEDSLFIECSAQGEDLPIAVRMEVDAERMLVILYSELPFDVPEDKRVEMSLAISAINYTLVDGSFDYNVLNGNLLFRLTSSFRESMIADTALEYMLYVSCNTVEAYNDKLFMLCKGMMSWEDITKAANES
jgi:hypothetical protein